MEDENDDDGPVEDSSEQIQYLGGGLSHSEFNNLIELDCDTTLSGNEDFGPQVIGTPNYFLFMGVCPAGCYSKGSAKVYGRAIHPE